MRESIMVDSITKQEMKNILTKKGFTPSHYFEDKHGKYYGSKEILKGSMGDDKASVDFRYKTKTLTIIWN